MKKLLLILFASLSTAVYSQKYSIFGGNIEVTQIGSNQFIMSATVQIDSFNVTSMTISAFDNATDTFVKTFTISLDSSAIIPLRYQTHIIDTIYVNYLSDTFNLSNNPNGYYFVNNEFNKIKNLLNFENGNYIFTCQIPDPAIPFGNSNPKFTNFNDSLYLLLHIRSTLNFSCTDKDGDMLVYSIFQSYDSVSSSGGKPFVLSPFKLPNYLGAIFGPGPVVHLDTSTGYFESNMFFKAKHVVPIKCEEFRNGVKIGEVHRDITLCPNNVFVSINKNEFLSQLNIFPNPSNGNFTISIEEYNHSNFDLNVIDVTGKLVYSQQINSAQTSINLENLKKGIYFVQLNDGVHQTTKRIVIK